MCGRTACTLTKESISYATACGEGPSPWLDNSIHTYEPHFNQTSGHCLPVLVSAKNKSLSIANSRHTHSRVLCPMRWGLRPVWLKADQSSAINPINCRFETLVQKKSFSSPLKNGRRCVAVVDGFFEWKTNRDNIKVPYFLYFPQKNVDYKNPDYSWLEDQSKLICDRQWRGPRLLTVAGLFNHSIESGYTFTIITVPSHPNLEWLHHRMPAVLDSEKSVRDWLDFEVVTADEAIKLLVPFGGLEFHCVSRLVSYVTNNSYRNLLPNDDKPKQKTIDQWLKKKVHKESTDEEIKDEKEDYLTPTKRNKQ